MRASASGSGWSDTGMPPSGIKSSIGKKRNGLAKNLILGRAKTMAGMAGLQRSQRQPTRKLKKTHIFWAILAVPAKNPHFLGIFGHSNGSGHLAKARRLRAWKEGVVSNFSTAPPWFSQRF